LTPKECSKSLNLEWNEETKEMYLVDEFKDIDLEDDLKGIESYL
jgi:hypothetical protein